MIISRQKSTTAASTKTGQIQSETVVLILNVVQVLTKEQNESSFCNWTAMSTKRNI